MLKNKFINYVKLIGRPRVIYSFIYLTNSWSEWFYSLFSFFLPVKNDKNIIIKYEEKFASHVDMKYGFSFGSGRMALFAILKALNYEQGSEIIVPAFTCVVVPNALIYAGYIPVYVDINLSTFNIEFSKIRTLISKKTKAIYIQHTFAYPCLGKELDSLLTEFNLDLIEDCAHGPISANLGLKKRHCFPKVSFYSTDRSKFINTVLGGMALTSDALLAQELKKVQSQAVDLKKIFIKKIQFNFIIEFILTAPPIYWLGKILIDVLIKLRLRAFFPDELLLEKPTYYPCKLSSFQAKLGLMQIRKINKIFLARQLNVNAIERAMKIHPENSPLPLLRYSFLVTNPKSFYKKYCPNLEGDSSRWFSSPFQGRNLNLEDILYKPGYCPNAEYVAQHIINIPTLLRGETRSKWNKITSKIFLGRDMIISTNKT